MTRLSVKDHIPSKLIKTLDAKNIEIVLRDKAAHRARQKAYEAKKREGKAK